jgi:hypothetical protein
VSCQVQCRFALVVQGIWQGFVLEQQLAEVDPAVEDCPVQQRIAIRILNVALGTWMTQQNLAAFLEAFFDSCVQGHCQS